jgi:flagellar hook-length control protein FliK
MQSVLEVLKNAEKPTSTEGTVGPIADVRANSSMTAAKTSAAQAGNSASAPAGSDNASQVARAQFVQRVERAFAAMGNRDGSVRLKLSPPELGVLKLEIGVHKGVMRARVEAETPAAQSLLLDNLPDLRDRLAQQNIHIQQFDVDLMDRSLGGMPQNAFGQSDSGSRQNGRSSPKSNGSENAAVGAASASSPQRAGMGGGLNVIV